MLWIQDFYDSHLVLLMISVHTLFFAETQTSNEKAQQALPAHFYQTGVGRISIGFNPA